MNPLLFIAITAIVAVPCFLVDRSHRRKLARRMQYRPQRNDEEFARLFPSDQGAIAVQIRQILQQWADIDLARMAPTDEFCLHLGLARLDGLDVAGFIEDIERAFHIRIPDSEAERIGTLKQMVEFVASTKAE